MRYLLTHWRGQHSLAWSFWVNLVLISVSLFALQDVLFTTLDTPVRHFAVLVALLIVLIHLSVFTWQAVGLLRACDDHVRNLGSIVNTWGVQLGLIVVFLNTALNVFGAWHLANPREEAGALHQVMLNERASRYRIETSGISRQTRLSGSLELGIDDALRIHLEQHPATRTVVLDSDGGNIFQARALARTIRRNKLDTLVTGRCLSACTIAFIGGRQRLISPAGRLGFHQYRKAAKYLVPYADPEREQQADRDLYALAGVSHDFLARMFQADSQNLWFPTLAELVSARVVTGVFMAGD